MRQRSRDYTCSACGENFVSTRSEEEAWDEATTIFGESTEDTEVAVVCENCWKKLMAV